MRAVPFPVVGAIAPAVTATILWLATGSTFALLGAIIAPTMIVAHFLDARRRAKSEAAREDALRARREAIGATGARREHELEIAALNRLNPSVADIAAHVNWAPSRDGSTRVRAGHTADGTPWLIDIAEGLAVAGSGSAADAVWDAVTFAAVSNLGEPVTREGAWRWVNGATLVRGESEATATVIRCEGGAIVSSAVRGQIPVGGDWIPDDVSRIESARERLRSSNVSPLSLTLSDQQPHILVAGRTGSGKSRALTALLIDWATRFTPEEFSFVGFDFKGGATIAPLARLPHHLATVTDLDSTLVPRALAGIANEMRRREAVFAQRGVAGISNTTGIARLAVVVDEVHELLRQHPLAHDVFADIARRGRSLGIHLVLSVQHPAGVLRETVLGNVPVRLCLTMNTSHDVAQVLGRIPPAQPESGNAWCNPGDGSLREVRIADVYWGNIAALDGDASTKAPWEPPLRGPVPREGRPGFGVIDDVERARHVPAEWHPADGDVTVIGDARSGRTSALRSLVAGRSATWVSSLSELSHTIGIVVVDDLDRVLREMGPREGDRFLDALAVARRDPRVDAVLVGTSPPLNRALGSFRHVLTLRTATMDEHRASGAPPETFDPAAAPGVGTWRGLRCVVYASTDSSETASIP